MVSLLDVNLLIALAWPSHVHHRAAIAWFLENRHLGWATCPLTQSGFVARLVESQALPEAKAPRETILLLQRIASLPHHQFWHDDVSLATSSLFDATRLSDYRQVTDAHLVTLALHRGGRLATLDRKIRSLVPRGRIASEVVCVIPTSAAPPA